MAQPPLPPRTTPLQDDEIALARVLRALPADEPSGKVDAAILAAATDAVAGEASPAPPAKRGPRTLRWLPTWAIGTAAAAVLAVGIGSQLRLPLAPERRSPAQAEAVAPASAPAPTPRVPIELVDPTPPREIPPTFPPPEAPRAMARPAVPPPPPPPPPPLPASAEPFPATPALEDAAEAFAPPPAAAAAAEAQAYAETQRQRDASARTERADARAEAERRHAQAAGLAARKAAPLPPVAADVALPRDAWLERIRERVRAGDRSGARESLARFRRAHPQVPVPDDLAPLRP